MLSAFRKNSSALAIKILMSVLVLTFVLWGVGDLIRQHNKFIAFSVGDIEVTDVEWQRMFEQHLVKLENNFKHKFTKEEIKNFGIHTLILNQAINELILLQEAKSLGIMVSDDMVKYEISALPPFQKDGKFDKVLFEQTLRSMQISEKEFVKNVRNGLAQHFLTFAVTSNHDMPPLYINQLMKARSLYKNLAIIQFPLNTTIAKFPEVEGEKLNEIYNEIIADLTTPEKRDISYLTFGLANVSVSKDINDDELKQHYEEKSFMFTEPEKRKVRQIFFKNENDAKKAHDKLSAGEDFNTVGKEFNPDVKDLSIGNVTSIGFEKNLSSAIFNAKLNQNTGIVQSSLGFHIFTIDEITPSNKLPFEAAKVKLITNLLEERKFEALSKLAQTVEQEVSSGKNLTDIAKEHDFKVLTIAGLNAHSENELMKVESFKNAVLTIADKSVSSVSPLSKQEGYFILQVDKVEPEIKISLTDAKPRLLKIWDERKVQYALHEMANDLVAKFHQQKIEKINFEEVQKFAAANNFPAPKLVKYSGKLFDKSVPEAVYAVTNHLKKGEIGAPVFDNENGYYVAILTGFEMPQSPPEHAAQVNDVYESVPHEIMEQMNMSLREKFNVKIDENIVAKAIN